MDHDDAVSGAASSARRRAAPGAGPFLVACALLACNRSPAPVVGVADRPAPSDADGAVLPEAAASGVDHAALPEGGADAAVEASTAPEPAEDAGAAEVEERAPAACSHVPGVCCVAIQPLGDVPQELVDATAEALRGMYGFEIRVLEPVDLPRSAWYEPRGRWRAEKLNDFLRERVPEGCDRIAGLTVEDISTTKGAIEDWGILGLADMPGPTCVFSSYRCRRKVHDVPPIERLRRVAIHEVGHTLGLPHCPTYGCLLEDAGGKAETIDRETFLCDVCRERLGWLE